jgi:zinc transport system substrate-binding protein
MRMILMSFRRIGGPALLLAVLLPLVACGDASSVGGDAGTGGAGLTVVASFYPLQWATQQIAGGATRVGSLTKPGAEPHDLELTPRDVAAVSDADLVVYLKGFQPAVDDAVAQQGGDHALDLSGPADLSLTYTPIEAGRQQTGQAGATDPHFWLDPQRFAAATRSIAGRLESLDPAHTARYQRNENALLAKLTALDRDFRSGLATCSNPDLITSHNAFGYLAQRYHLTQVGITGLTPEEEPRATQLAAVTRFVRTHHVRTIYYETLVSPKIAKTVAAETGARTEVLDPIEGLSSASQGRDYLAIMRANLANLRRGQGCR